MTCFLVRCDSFLVFSAADPRTDGCLEPIQDEVWLDDASLSEGPADRIPTGLCVGRDQLDPGHFRLFRSPADRARAGFHQVAGLPVVVASWDAFLRSAIESGEPVG